LDWALPFKTNKKIEIMFRKILVTLALAFLSLTFYLNAQATVYIIEAAGIEFTPSSLDVMVGDTVSFQWVEGAHTTTSALVPDGAMTWDAMLDNSHLAFDYVVEFEGVYNFFCAPHFNMGMDGSFTATASTGIANVVSQALRAYPSPFKNDLFIDGMDESSASSCVVFDMLGNELTRCNAEKFRGKIKIDTGDLIPGVYLVTIMNGEGRKSKTLRVMKSGN
jgi:plastocyanin